MMKQTESKVKCGFLIVFKSMTRISLAPCPACLTRSPVTNVEAGAASYYAMSHNHDCIVPEALTSVYPESFSKQVIIVLYQGNEADIYILTVLCQIL